MITDKWYAQRCELRQALDDQKAIHSVPWSDFHET